MFGMQDEIDIRQPRCIVRGFLSLEHPQPVCGMAQSGIRLHRLASLANGLMRGDDHRHLRGQAQTVSDAIDAYALTAGATRLENRAEVERFLPDILGRALARCWIDAGFRTRFCADPRGTLAEHRIELPGSIEIEVVTKGQTRPMVIVSERPSQGTQRRRLLYLQLVMVAGK